MQRPPAGGFRGTSYSRDEQVSGEIEEPGPLDKEECKAAVPEKP